MGVGFAPREPVWYVAPKDAPTDPARVLAAIVIQSSSQRVYLRVTLPDGRWAYRWVSQTHVRRLVNAEE